MSDIVAFIEARLAEDEAIAQAAYTAEVDADPDEVVRWRNGGDGDVYLDGRHGNQAIAVGPWNCPMNEQIVSHVVRWDPDRVLAEIAAKRRVLSRHCPGVARWERDPIPCAGCHGCPVGRAGFLHFTKDINECPELRDLASAWADHPDFDLAWRIDG